MLVFFISFIITLIALIVLRPISIKFKLIDYPSSRKKHIGNIPLIGGISIFAGLITSQLILYQFDSKMFTILVSCFLILLLGIYDDIKNLKAKTKLYFQIIIVALVIIITDIKINSLGYLLVPSYSVDLGFLSIPFSIIAIIGLTNAFNMIDGIDGQAAALGMIALSTVLFFSANLDGHIFYNLVFATVGGLVPFFILNILNNIKVKVFLGDGGSLLIGFITSLSLVYSTNNVDIISPRFALWCVAIPLLDFFCVVFIRRFQKKSLTQANRDHLHHFLGSFGFSQIKVLIITILSSLMLLSIGVFAENYLPSLSFGIFMTLFCAYLITRFLFILKFKL